MRTVPLLLAAVLWAPLVAAAPSQIHLGITDDPSSSVSVHWLDDRPDSTPEVILIGPDGSERAIAGQSSTGPSAGFAYEALLDGLDAGTNYSYRVGDQTFAFATPRDEGAFTLVALGDMGVTEQAQKTVDTIEDLDPTLVLHAGDLSYATHDPQTWATWFEMIEPIAATRPWVTAIGNHEVTVGGLADEGADANAVDPGEAAFYFQRFGLPGNERWYSFDWQGVHFVALDTFTEARVPPAQVGWLQEDLAAHAAATWTIVVLHEPPYSSNLAHGSSPRVQQLLVPVFDEHGVDLVLAAHDHAYERTHPIRQGSVDANGTVYVVTGGGGNGIYPDFDDDNDWSAVRIAEFHVTTLNVTPTRIEGRAVSTDDGRTLDSFVLTKEGPSGELRERLQEATPAPPGALLVAVLVGLALVRRQARRG